MEIQQKWRLEAILEKRMEKMNLSSTELMLYKRIFERLYPVEREFCASILYEGSKNRTARNLPMVYPGAYTDIEHALLIPAKEHILIDPAYKDTCDPDYKHCGTTSIERIVQAMHKLGLKPVRDDMDAFEVDSGFTTISYAVGQENRLMTLMALDATQYELPSKAGSYFLKNPCLLKETGIPSLFELESTEKRERNIDSLADGGLYLEQRTRTELPSALKARLRPIADGVLVSKVFYQDQDYHGYLGNLYKKVA